MQPPIAVAKQQLVQAPGDLKSTFRLADAWSDAGCFTDALQVLQDAAQNHNDKELQTRLRVARSVVGEEHYFDNLDRAADAAKLKRAVFRCKTINDLDACNEAVRSQPDDAQLVMAQGDALMHAKRPGEALSRYRLAQNLGGQNADVASKIAAADELAGRSRTAPASPAAPSPPAPARVATTARKPAPTPLAAASPSPTPTRLAAASASVTPLTAADKPPRRYSNIAPEGRSH